jgi:hypothetical protein
METRQSPSSAQYRPGYTAGALENLKNPAEDSGLL